MKSDILDEIWQIWQFLTILDISCQFWQIWQFLTIPDNSALLWLWSPTILTILTNLTKRVKSDRMCQICSICLLKSVWSCVDFIPTLSRVISLQVSFLLTISDISGKSDILTNSDISDNSWQYWQLPVCPAFTGYFQLLARPGLQQALVSKGSGPEPVLFLNPGLWTAADMQTEHFWQFIWGLKGDLTGNNRKLTVKSGR